MKNVFLTAMMMAATLVRADIVEISKMSQGLENVTSDTLVVFDLDNTVVEPVQTLGTVQWVDSEEQKLVDAGMPREKANDIAAGNWVRVQLKTKNRLVENETRSLIMGLQRRGVKVVALTARPVAVEAQTKQMLKDLDVPFHKSWDVGTKFESPFPGASYQDGVIFVGQKNSKGAVLREFMKQNNVAPKALRFIDDKRKYLDTLVPEMQALGIEYMGYRYGAADARVKAYDERIAQVQWDIFESQDRLISDVEAKKILEGFRKSTNNPIAHATDQMMEEVQSRSDMEPHRVENCFTASETAEGVTIQCEGVYTFLVHGGHAVTSALTCDFEYVLIQAEEYVPTSVSCS